jgi:hypothetical protein
MEAVGLTDTAPAQVADERSAGAYEAWRNRLAEMWRQAAPAAVGHCSDRVMLQGRTRTVGLLGVGIQRTARRPWRSVETPGARSVAPRLRVWRGSCSMSSLPPIGCVRWVREGLGYEADIRRQRRTRIVFSVHCTNGAGSNWCRLKFRDGARSPPGRLRVVFSISAVGQFWRFPKQADCGPRVNSRAGRAVSIIDGRTTPDWYKYQLAQYILS